MKNTTTLLLLLFSILFSAQNFELSTLRIGDYKIFMHADEAEKIAKRKFQIFEDYEQSNTINYFGEEIGVTISEMYESEQVPEIRKIYSLKTKSPRFRTKSGMGVGSSREDLINAYKNYPNYTMNQGWDQKAETWSKTESRFSLTDNDAGTILVFVIQKGIVTSIEIYINEGGC